MFILIRWTIFSLIIFYNYQSTGVPSAAGFLAAFLMMEIAIFRIWKASVYVKTILKNMENLQSAAENVLSEVVRVNRKLVPNLPIGDVQFINTELTDEEIEFIRKARGGSVQALNDFLRSRCEDKGYDFEELPVMLRVVVAQRIIAASGGIDPAKLDNINTDEDWPELINDTPN